MTTNAAPTAAERLAEIRAAAIGLPPEGQRLHYSYVLVMREWLGSEAGALAVAAVAEEMAMAMEAVEEGIPS